MPEDVVIADQAPCWQEALSSISSQGNCDPHHHQPSCHPRRGPVAGGKWYRFRIAVFWQCGCRADRDAAFHVPYHTGPCSEDLLQ